MSWDYEIAREIKGNKTTNEPYVIGEIKQKEPELIISAYGGEINLKDTQIFQTTMFNNWWTAADEEDLIGKKVLLLGYKKFLAVCEVI